MTADCCAESYGFNSCQGLCQANKDQYILCRDSIGFILESAKEINKSIALARTGQLNCASAAAETEKFMNSMDKIYNNNCRLFQAYGNLKIIGIKNNNITIENNGTTDYYGIVSCKYMDREVLSECISIKTTEKKTLNMNLDQGIYELSCAVNGSWFDDCRASSRHSEMSALVNIPYPVASLRIIDYNAVDEQVVVDVANRGEKGIASVLCKLSSGAKQLPEKNIELSSELSIGTNQNSSLKLAENIEAGTLLIEKCSVYYNSILQHTLRQYTLTAIILAKHQKIFFL